MLALIGRRGLAALGVLIAVVQFGRLVQDPRPPTPPDGAELSVAVANVLTSNRAHGEVVDWLRTEPAEVVVLLEVDETWLSALEAAGLPYRTEVRNPRDDNFGIALLRLDSSSAEVDGEAVMVTLPSGGSLPVAVAQVRKAGKRARVIGVHTLPPLGSGLSAARDELMAWTAAEALLDERVIVLADLNVTPWSNPFRQLLADGRLAEARPVRSLTGTWPWFVPPGLGIPLDHVLHGPGLATTAYAIGPSIGSDHRPVTATLRWTP